jgi:lipid-A-disaccharide synthase-like uncharacterized protein
MTSRRSRWVSSYSDSTGFGLSYWYWGLAGGIVCMYYFAVQEGHSLGKGTGMAQKGLS